MCTICTLSVEFGVEHPMSLTVAVATRNAIEIGVLPDHDKWQREDDLVSLRHDAVALMQGMGKRIEDVLDRDTLIALPSFYALMIESGTWAYFRPTRKGFDRFSLPRMPQFDDSEASDSAIVLSQTAARQLVSGRLSFESALTHNLIIFDGAMAARIAVTAMGKSVFPEAGFSRFECELVA